MPRRSRSDVAFNGRKACGGTEAHGSLQAGGEERKGPHIGHTLQGHRLQLRIMPHDCFRAGPRPEKIKKKRSSASAPLPRRGSFRAPKNLGHPEAGSKGKRLVAAMRPTLEAMERHGELMLTSAVRDKLLSISASTVDRMLAPDRARLALKGRTGTEPSHLAQAPDTGQDI